MTPNSAGGVLLDTSFFLRFLNTQERLHRHADGYFRYFLDRSWPMYLSTIVIAEYCVRGRLDELPLRHLRILPFTAQHAQCAGVFRGNLHDERNVTLPEVPRLLVQNDTKLFAQADQETNITHYLSADERSRKVFARIDQLRPRPRFQFISLGTPPEVTFSLLFPQ